VTGKPIKLVGVGEKLDALEAFHPERDGSTHPRMGDVLSLIEKAEASIDRDQAAEMAQQLRKEGFTLEDFRDQLKSIRKMGLDGVDPRHDPRRRQGAQADAGMHCRKKELQKIEAIINSMTAQERRDHAFSTVRGACASPVEVYPRSGREPAAQAVHRGAGDDERMQKLVRRDCAG